MGRSGALLLCSEGVRHPITPDDNASVGRDVGEVEGFYWPVGFCGYGFMQSPAVSRRLADLIVGGEAGIDLEPLASEGFEVGRLVRETRVI